MALIYNVTTIAHVSWFTQALPRSLVARPMLPAVHVHALVLWEYALWLWRLRYRWIYRAESGETHRIVVNKKTIGDSFMQQTSALSRSHTRRAGLCHVTPRSNERGPQKALVLVGQLRVV